MCSFELRTLSSKFVIPFGQSGVANCSFCQSIRLLHNGCGVGLQTFCAVSVQAYSDASSLPLQLPAPPKVLAEKWQMLRLFSTDLHYFFSFNYQVFVISITLQVFVRYTSSFGRLRSFFCQPWWRWSWSAPFCGRTSRQKYRSLF